MSVAALQNRTMTQRALPAGSYRVTVPGILVRESSRRQVGYSVFNHHVGRPIPISAEWLENLGRSAPGWRLGTPAVVTGVATIGADGNIEQIDGGPGTGQVSIGDGVTFDEAMGVPTVGARVRAPAAPNLAHQGV